MKCQKCGYISFDHLVACKKCGTDASMARDALGLVAGRPTMPFFLGALISGSESTPVTAAPAPAPMETAHEDVDSLFAEIDFGSDDLDFELTEEATAVTGAAPASGAKAAAPSRGGDLSELDDIEIVIGSALDEELALDMSALDDSPAAPKPSQDDFHLDLDLNETAPMAAVAKPEAAPTEDAEGNDLGLNLDSEIDFELNLDDLSPPQAETSQASPSGLDEELVIDLGDEDIQSLLRELEDHKKGAKAAL